MRIVEFSDRRACPIDLFSGASVSGVALGDGAGEAHVYALHFGPGGAIGPHPAGFGQLFLVVQGEG